MKKEWENRLNTLQKEIEKWLDPLVPKIKIQEKITIINLYYDNYKSEIDDSEPIKKEVTTYKSKSDDEHEFIQLSELSSESDCEYINHIQRYDENNEIIIYNMLELSSESENINTIQNI